MLTATARPINVTQQRNGKLLVLAPPTVPSSIDLPEDLREKINTAQHMYQSLPVYYPSNYRYLLGELRDTATASLLMHPLGEHIVDANKPQDLKLMAERSENERAVATILGETLLASIQKPNPVHFLNAIRSIVHAVESETDSLRVWRSKPIYTSTDNFGRCWEFPNHTHILSVLKKLHDCLYLNQLESHLVEATVAYGVLNWLHPFNDGNGRTSRVIFNVLLSRIKLGGELYLPIKDINHLARGGHEVRLRYTVLTGDWKELLEYFADVVTTWRMILQQGALSAIPLLPQENERNL
jgi:Fic/DOC family